MSSNNHCNSLLLFNGKSFCDSLSNSCSGPHRAILEYHIGDNTVVQLVIVRIRVSARSDEVHMKDRSDLVHPTSYIYVVQLCN